MSLKELIDLIDYEIKINNIDFSDIKFKNILNKYENTDWKNYISDVIIPLGYYSRKKIFENDRFEVYILLWDKNCDSGTHDHSKNGCWLKILNGKLIEKIYDNNLNLSKTNILNKDDIGFMKDDIGFHSICNNSDITAISLHIYSPSKHCTKYF